MKLLSITDFSTTSKQALQYSIDLLNTSEVRELHLLHVLEDQKDTEKATQQLHTFIEGIDNPKGIDIQTDLVLGDLYDEVGLYTRKQKFDFLVFGTHGAKGLQKVFGSHAVKLIQHTSCPCIVVQKEIAIGEDGIKEIALPLTLEVEDKKILAYAAALAKQLDARIEIIYPEHSDEFLAATIRRNLNFTTGHFKEQNIPFGTNAVPAGKDFDDHVIRVADEKECDLIAVVNHHEDGIRNLFGWSFDQNMIENNAHIPVLTIDAKPAGDVHDIFSTTR